MCVCFWLLPAYEEFIFYFKIIGLMIWDGLQITGLYEVAVVYQKQTIYSRRVWTDSRHHSIHKIFDEVVIGRCSVA